MGNNLPSYLLSPEAWLTVGATVLLVRLSSRGSFSIIDSLFVDLKVLRPTKQSFRRAYGKDNHNNNHHQRLHSSHSKHQKNKNPMLSPSSSSSNTSSKSIAERRIRMLEFSYDCIQPNEMAKIADQSAALDEDEFYSFLDSSLNFTAGCIFGAALIWIFGLLRTLYYSCENADESFKTQPFDLQQRSYASLARVTAIYPTLFLLLCNAQVTISFLGGTVSDVVREMQQKTLQTRLAQVFIGLAVYWLLKNAPLLQVLGISSTAFALEEFSARLLLFNCCMYNIAPRNTTYVIELIDRCTSLTRIVLAIVAGSVIGDFIAPIMEKARTAAIILEGSCEIDKPLHHENQFSRLTVKTGIILNAVLPCLVMDTYFSGNRSTRVLFAWSWVIIDLALTRPLLQSYLYQALIEAAPDLGLREITFERLQKHFTNQYKSLIVAASGFSCTSMFVIMLLLFAHMCGFYGSFDGDSSADEISFDLTLRQVPTPTYDSIQSYSSSIFGENIICPPFQKIVDHHIEEHYTWKHDSLSPTIKNSLPTTLSTIFSFEDRDLSSVITLSNGGIDEEQRELQQQGIWAILLKQFSLANDVEPNTTKEPRPETTLTTMFFHKFISPTIVYAMVNFFGFLFCCLWTICYTCSMLVFFFNSDNGYRIRLASSSNENQ